MLQRLLDRAAFFAAPRLRDPIVALYNAAGRHLCSTGDHDVHTIHSLWEDGVETELVVCDRPGCRWAEQYVYRPARVWDQEER